MVIGLLELNISIPDARSLKDKRMVIKSMKERIVNKMNVSAAETGRQDEWRFSEFAFVTIAAEKHLVEKRLSELQERLWSDPRYVIMNTKMSYF